MICKWCHCSQSSNCFLKIERDYFASQPSGRMAEICSDRLISLSSSALAEVDCQEGRSDSNLHEHYQLFYGARSSIAEFCA